MRLERILSNRAISWGLATAFAIMPLASYAAEQVAAQALQDAVGEYAYDKTPEKLLAVKKLLDKGIEPDIQTVFLASYYKAPDALDLLLAKAPHLVNEPVQDNGETLLLSALNNLREPTVSPAEEQVIDRLIKAGANVNVIAQGGTETPLIAAARGGSAAFPHPDLVQRLLRAGADPKLTTPNGFTALTDRGATNLEVIKLLIAAGADPFAVTDVGSTPLHFVCARTAYELSNKPDPQAGQRIALLLKPGASIDATHPQKKPYPVMTPLGEAAMSNNPDCVQALLDAGAKKTAPAFMPSYIAVDPSVKGRTVQQSVQSSAKKYPTLYSPEIVKLFE
ncbi:ankyrin repeat domain-containing protein [Burkholderia sp. Bp9002]|nr:ankyrin repeat domain-containing protein [Burkholderia sp. Bp9002]